MQRRVDGKEPRPERATASGAIADRPWGETLAAIGLSGKRGQLTLLGADGRPHRIAFASGMVVGATSPVPADAIARIALAARLVSAAQARALARLNDLERFGEVTNLTPQQGHQLKRLVVAQRAARTFAVDAGDYTVDDRITIPVVLGIEIDVRAVIYQGMRQHLSPQRLAATVGNARFVLRAGAVGELGRYDFTDAERPVLEALLVGTSVPELEATHRELDPRLVEAVLSTLAVSDAIVPCASQDVSIARAPTPREPTMTRVPTPRDPTLSYVPMLVRHDPVVVGPRPTVPASPASPAPSPAQPRGARSPTTPRVKTRSLTDPFLDQQRTRMRPSALTRAEVEEVIAIGIELLDEGVDLFTFLGLPVGAPADEVRDAYLEFARYLRPERLAELQIRDPHHHARTVFAQVVIAFTTLTDPERRADYLARLVR